MKLKAVLRKGTSPELVAALESPEFRERVWTDVLEKHLHVVLSQFGPAQGYIQECDFYVGDPRDGCEVRLTGVSTNKSRSTNNFHEALAALEHVYYDTIKRFLKPGDRFELFVSLMVDKPPLEESSSLLERDPVMINGTKGKSLEPTTKTGNKSVFENR